MPTDTLHQLLLWCTLFDLGLLSVWLLLFVFDRPWMLWLHRRWFTLREETFDAIHYGGMGLFKLWILVFNLVPLLALSLIRTPG